MMKCLIIVIILIVINIQLSESTRSEKTVSVCDRNRQLNNTFYRLTKTVTPIKYKVRFRSDLNPYKFSGTETITLMINNKTDIIELNSVDLYIESASFKTRRLRVDVKTIWTCVGKQTVILQFYKHLDKGTGNLTLTFTGNINNMVTGFYRTHPKSISEEGMIAVTDFGPTDSRRGFPNLDEPGFKAMIEIIMMVPKNHISLSNMNEQKRRVYNEMFEEVKFEASPPMTTAQMAIVVGRFSFLEQLTEDNEVLVRIFTPIDRQDEALFAMDVTNKLLMFYKYYFNTSYPLLKLDLVSIPEYPSASETWGLITFTEKEILVNNQTTEEEKRTVALVIAHALAHQWFGNLVTLSSWDEMWITEGFATFIENEAIDILYPNWKVWQTFVSKDIQNAMEIDSLPNSMPIETKIDSPSEISEKFVAESYQKSTAIIRMISGWTGTVSFRSGIRKFVSKYSYKSSMASDLWKTFEEEKDMQLKDISNSWAKQQGFPVINVKERQSGEKRILNITQEIFLPIDNSNNKSDPIWNIPISITNQFNPYIPSVNVLMKNKEMEITVNDVWEGEWVKLNFINQGYYRVNYPIEMLNKFVNSIEEKSMPAMDRLNILSDLFAVIQSGRLSTEIGLKYLLHYKKEDNLSVWEYILKLMSKLDLLLSDTDVREYFWEFGRDLLSTIKDKFGWDQKIDENLRITKMRPKLLDLLATFNDKKVIAEGLKRYEEYKNDNYNGTNDLLITIYKIFGSNCEEQTFEELFELYKNGVNAEKRNHIIVALTATTIKDRILKVLNFSLEENIRFIDSSKIISGLCHSMIGRDKTWKFFEKNFIELQRMFGSSNVEMNLLIRNFIEKFSSEEKAKEFEQFFGSYNVIDKSVETSLEKIRIDAKWLNRDIIQIREYLTKTTFGNRSLITES